MPNHRISLSRSRVASAATDADVKLRRLFGQPVGIATALLEAFWTANPWVPVSWVATRADVSEDTARRRLDELVSIGRARTRQRGKRARVYRLHSKWAERGSDVIGMVIKMAEDVQQGERLSR